MKRFLLSAAMLLLAATSSRADLVDNFNSENGGVGQLNYYNFANWTIANANVGGSVDLIGNGFFDFYPGNGLYVDLEGSTNGPGGLMTTIQTFAPGTYVLSYDLAGSARGVDNTVAVNFGPFSEVYSIPSTQPYTLYTNMVTLTAPSQLTIQDLGVGNVGAILDNVSVISSAVPEPSTWVLASLGTLGFIGYARRRKPVAMAGLDSSGA